MQPTVSNPPRGYVSIKASKDGILKQVVPEFSEYKENYELLWDIGSNDGYLHLVGIMQKFVDQAISANTNYDPTRFESGKVPMKKAITRPSHCIQVWCKNPLLPQHT